MSKLRASLVDIPLRFVVKKQQTEGILSYDLDNDYPGRVMDIINGSGTAYKCNDIYAKFINGKGFTDVNFAKTIVNTKGQTADNILRKTAYDLAMFRGFALHVNYDANGKITSISHVPFEHCRFAIDKDLNILKIAVYDDWGKRKYTNIKKERIHYIDFYDPAKAVEEAANEWDKYKGQIFYYSADGLEYPKATADPVLEDCVTDYEIKTAKFKNITTGLMASHIFLKRGEFETDEARDDFKTVLKGFQGAENMSKLMLFEVPAGEESPDIKKLDIQDNDKLFEYTEGSVQNNIRMCYGLPPVLVGKDVSVGFATEIIEQAFNWVNFATLDERYTLEEIFKKIFSNYYTATTTDFSIQPLTYVNQSNGLPQLQGANS